MTPETRPPTECRVCRGYGWIAQKQFIDDGYGEPEPCPACEQGGPMTETRPPTRREQIDRMHMLSAEALRCLKDQRYDAVRRKVSYIDVLLCEMEADLLRVEGEPPDLAQRIRAAAMESDDEPIDDVIEQIASDYRAWMGAMEAIKTAESWPPNHYPSMNDRWLFAAQQAEIVRLRGEARVDPVPPAEELAKRVESGLRAGRLLGKAFDGATLDELVDEIVRLRQEKGIK